MNEVHTLSHSTWNCKYHIVFAPKYRRKVFYGEKRYEIGKLLRTLCKWKGVNVLEAEACPDHIHSYAGGDTAENQCVGFHGVSEREKQFADIRSMEQHQIQVQESRILVQRVLCGHSWEKYKKDKGVYPTSAGRRRSVGAADTGYVRPVYG